jgi:hypothetical protein
MLPARSHHPPRVPTIGRERSPSAGPPPRRRTDWITETCGAARGEPGRASLRLCLVPNPGPPGVWEFGTRKTCTDTRRRGRLPPATVRCAEPPHHGVSEVRHNAQAFPQAGARLAGRLALPNGLASASRNGAGGVPDGRGIRPGL